VAATANKQTHKSIAAIFNKLETNNCRKLRLVQVPLFQGFSSATLHW